jgi:hypothetical protein
MNWVLLSFAVITPMSRSIAMAFSRREMALSHLALIKSTLLNIYSAHACWDWAKEGKTGRDPNFDWLQHCDNILQASLQLCSDLTRLLTLPSFNRARHRVTSFGRREAQEVELVLSQLHLSIVERMATITDLCEVLKYQGLPPNEATRIRQWERMVAEKIGKLVAALVTFERMFIIPSHPLFTFHFHAQRCYWPLRNIAHPKHSEVSLDSLPSFFHPFTLPFMVKWPRT